MRFAPLREIVLGNRPPGDLVEQVRIDTTLFPPIVINRPLDDKGASGPPSAFMQALRPQITITSPVLEQPSVRAPYGVPTANYWPYVQVAILATTALAFYGIVRFIRR